jgi:(p)ppGpp synthase/HD superfamily hydrolase
MGSKRQISTTTPILSGMGLNAITIVAIPLHDTGVFASISRKDFEQKSGLKVTGIWDGVTKLKQVSPDVDSMCNGTAGDHAMEYRRKMLCELEDLIFRYLEPETYHTISVQLDECWADRENHIACIKTFIQEVFAREGLQAEITGRPKLIYSIYCKMRRKNLPFSQIYDIRAIRIVVDTTLQCYRALNIIHTIFHAIPGEFDDFIVFPKSNLYRSLHTAVVDSEGKTLEVQIRTRNMHDESEYGAAAHWRYKEEQHDLSSLTTIQLTPSVRTVAAHDGILPEETRLVETQIGINWIQIDLEQFRHRLEVELDRCTHDPETSITDDDLIRKATIVWMHLKDIRDYYTRLDRLEAEAEAESET